MQGNHFLSMAGSQVEGSFWTGKQQGPLGNEGNLAERKIDHSKVFKFDNKASGIILIKQDYKKLFHNPTQKLEFPIEDVELLFFNKKNSDSEVLKIILRNGRLEIDYTRPKVEGNRVVVRTTREEVNIKEILFPTPEQAPTMLQKKIWIELNRLNRTLAIYTGDVVNFKGQKPLYKKFFESPLETHNGWKNEAEKFKLPTYDGNNQNVAIKVPEAFTEIQYFFVKFKVKETSEEQVQSERKINDYVTLQILNLTRIFDPVIEEKASLLKPTLANLESIPAPLRHLFDCLKNLDIRNLPDSNAKSINYEEKNEYLNWKSLQFALHHSLVTPYGTNAKGIPMGIMNHLYKMKCKKEYKEFKPYKGEGKDKSYLTKDQMLDEIYNNRAGYIRLELLPHEGLGPGSMAVLEIWPPFHCSSIHNHGDAYGLIKVLSGSIRVQNYSELAFSTLEGTPYLESNYEQDQYTWLSELSFGIHRLVNVKPQTCFTLQSYYHNDVTEEYFSVVKKINDTLTYIEYYPQNDWVNYLNDYENQENDPKDNQFIRSIIAKYGLMVNGQLDTSFQRMVLTLKKEYEYYHHELATDMV